METPKIPTLKDSQKPQVKIKGLGAGLSLFDRLKQFKKKDLAFILAGLGTLFMAPLAEHFMMAPEAGDGTMQAGWGGKGGTGGGMFGNGSSPYENGITGLAPGSAIGGGSDVITPLNVRDPSALVMGPGQQQQPPAGSIAPPTPPAGSKEPDLKDALANAAARAAGAATHKAPLPVPKPGVTGSGLRGLGVVSGGTSAGAGLGPINSSLAPNRAAGSNSLSDVRPASGYRGVAGSRGPGRGGGGAEALKAAAGGAGDIFNRGGSASGALETAANQQIPNGSAFGGNGQGGMGANDKGPGGNGNGGQKSVGESLDFLRQKSEMEKAIDLKWEMRKKRAMFPLELQQEMTKTILMDGVIKPLTKGMADLWGSFSPGSQSGYTCTNPNLPFIAGSRVSQNGDAGCGGKEYYIGPASTPGLALWKCGKDGGPSGGAPSYQGCSPITKGGSAADAKTPEERGPAGPGGLDGPNAEDKKKLSGMDKTCETLGSDLGSITGTLKDRATTLQTNGKEVGNARNSLIGGEPTCGSGRVAQSESALGQQDLAVAALRDAMNALATTLKGSAYATPAELKKAKDYLAAAKARMDAAEASMGNINPKEYFTGANPFTDGKGGTADESKAMGYFNDIKGSYTPLADQLKTRKTMQENLTKTLSAVTLAAGDADKVGTVQRAVVLRDAYDQLKKVADAKDAAAAKAANTTAQKAKDTAAGVVAKEAPARDAGGLPANDATFTPVAKIVTDSKTDTLKTAAETAAKYAADKPTATKEETVKAVDAFGAIVGTSDTTGVRKAAAEHLGTIVTELNTYVPKK